MQTTIDPMQPQNQQPAQVKRSWFRREKKQPKQKSAIANTQLATVQIERTNFYEKAIEWTHRADKIINLVLGYLLAIASVLGFMDVLSNGVVLNRVPYLFYVWLGIMGLGIDFQILLVVGRIPDLLSMSVDQWQKWVIGLFNIVFLVFLCVMSIMISAIFTEHQDVPFQIVVSATHAATTRPSTIGDAMSKLGINGVLFVYGRAALATLLLVLMAVDRTMERWRMQISASKLSIAEVITQSATPATAPAQPATPTSDLDKILQAVVQMNQQTLTQVQTMNQQTMQDLIAQTTQITVSVVEESLKQLTTSVALPSDHQIGQHAQTGPQAHVTGDLEVANKVGIADSASSQGIQDVPFKDQIEALLQGEPTLQDREIAARVGCSLRTANRWRLRIQQSNI